MHPGFQHFDPMDKRFAREIGLRARHFHERKLERQPRIPALPLVVHDASPAAAAATGKLAGVTVAATPAEVASRVSVLFTCLPNDAIVRAVYLGQATTHGA